ncbi:hypothetical protein T440DRAFT_533629 [Plenodomus tracheiphilus IPT5]|uniref:Uncharacterized protein n=1 Tax=Plenodomus tracheiphilus IPT5 TaxID=1408161 RepID=A0A6A7B1Y2_9PLEO|nr:hypothetical protein T440DRAFT_533629 [Plenodomus tracheiphilus IPT5]
MAHTSDPRFDGWSETPATPVRPRQILLEQRKSPHTPSGFMPQPPAPMMILTSSRRTMSRTGDEQRAELFLKSDVFANSPHDRAIEGQSTDEGAGSVEVKHKVFRNTLDINMTPATPPLTPSSDTSLASTHGTVITRLVTLLQLPRLPALSKQATFTMFLLAFTLVVLIAAVFATGTTIFALVQVFARGWNFVCILSDALDAGIGSVGFICGRAVGRFAQEFARGYQL